MRAVVASALMAVAVVAHGGNDHRSSAATGPEAAQEIAAGGPRIGRFPASHFFIARDLFLPATEPETVPAEEASFLEPHDEVYGVVLGGKARAYPITMLSYHHVVNDVIRGAPVAVTY